MAEGREAYLRLLNEASALLKNLDRLGADDLAAAMQRREDLLVVLRRVDAGIREVERDEAVTQFLQFREQTTERILEIDGLLIALAQEKQAAAKDKLASLSRSKTVSSVYQQSGAAKVRPWMDNTM
jgi:hypothetical protein